MKEDFYNNTKCEKTVSKNDVLEIMQCYMLGCYTAVRSKDSQGYNENYGATPVDSFFDEDCCDYLPSENWSLTEYCSATPESVDLDTWAQEFSEENKECFYKDMKKGYLYIASFHNEKEGSLDILIWDK